MEKIIPHDYNKVCSFLIELPADAIEWLCQKTVTDIGTETVNANFFLSLLSCVKTYPYKDDSFRRPQLLSPGQVQISELKLCEEWHLHRKRLHSMLELMDSLGLISLFSSRVATVVSFPCIRGWRMPDGTIIANPSATVDSDDTQASSEPSANKEQK